MAETLTLTDPAEIWAVRTLRELPYGDVVFSKNAMKIVNAKIIDNRKPPTT